MLGSSTSGTPVSGPGCFRGKATRITSWVLNTGARLVNQCLKKISKKEPEADISTEGDYMTEFSAVLANLNLTAIPEYVCSVRRSRDPQKYEVTPWSFECTVESPPLHGSYNVLFPITFDDGSKWILKIPSEGYNERWTESAASNLESEALTMRLLREKNVHVPEVYEFSATTNNVLNCPFILMEFVCGQPLYKGWFNKSTSKQAREVFRERCLQSLASEMIKVSSITYSRAGSPVYVGSENPRAVGPLRVPNIPLVQNRRITSSPRNSATEDPRPYCNIGPFDAARAYILSMLDQHVTTSCKLGQGSDKLLRLFVEWASQKIVKDDFVLTHPDLDLQNILVDDNGNVQAIVDWDGVMAAPRSIGCSFPKWLTHDWDPETYCYDAGMSSSARSVNLQDHSPKESAHYRHMYAKYFKEASVENSCLEPRIAPCGTDIRQSALYESLRKAITHPESTYFIVFKISDMIGQITGQKSFQVGYESLSPASSEIDSVKCDKTQSSNHRIDGKSDSSRTASTRSATSAEGFSSITPCSTPQSDVVSEMNLGKVLDSLTYKPEFTGLIQLRHERSATGIEGQEQHSVFLGTPEQKVASFRLPAVLRKVSKGLHSVVQRRKATIFQQAGPTGLSTVVDGTVFDIVNRRDNHTDNNLQDNEASNSAASISNKMTSRGATKATNAYEGKLIIQSDPSSTCADNHGLEQLTPEMQHQTEEELKTSKSSSKSMQETSSLPCSEAAQSATEDSSVYKRQKGGLCRQIVSKLAFPCQAPDVDTSSLPCMEVERTCISRKEISRKRRVASWIKGVKAQLRKNREDDISEASSIASSTTSSSILDTSGTGAIESTNSETSAVAVAHASESGTALASQQSASTKGVNIYDLDNLEPVDDDLLFNQRFWTRHILEDLADDKLDEARMQRLRSGFDSLLNSL